MRPPTSHRRTCRENDVPLVRELAGDGIPVTVTCRVLKIARQPYYRRPANPVTASELTAAHRAIALFDAHRDDPEIWYRFLVDEAREAGQVMAERKDVYSSRIVGYPIDARMKSSLAVAALYNTVPPAR